jgi:hypothetical protein
MFASRARRSLAGAVGLALGGSALALLGGAVPALGADVTLQLREVSVHRCLAPVKQPGTQSQNHNSTLKCRAGQRAFAVRQNTRYGFQVRVYVGGYDQFLSTHTFVFRNAVTGQRVKVPSISAADLSGHSAQRAISDGIRDEAFPFPIPETWTPGVYRMEYSITVRAATVLNNPPTATLSGAREFLVLPPA